MIDFLALTPSFRALADVIDDKLREIGPVSPIDGGVRVTTHCLYPSNGMVRVMVRGGVETVMVSDDGEALGEALAAGIEIVDPDKVLRPLVKQYGLTISGGIIHTPRIPVDASAVAILHVANVARDVANWLYEHNRIRRTRDFRKLLADFLASTFSDQVSETRLIGASNKQHRFANVISFANGRKLIVDAVAYDPSSINSRVVANLDIRSTNDPTIAQRIVFDDAEKWTAADLNLLQVGATVVPYSRAHDVIRRVAEKTRAA